MCQLHGKKLSFQVTDVISEQCLRNNRLTNIRQGTAVTKEIAQETYRTDQTKIFTDLLAGVWIEHFKRECQSAVSQMPQVCTCDNERQFTAQNVSELSHFVVSSDSSSYHHAATTDIVNIR